MTTVDADPSRELSEGLASTEEQVLRELDESVFAAPDDAVVAEIQQREAAIRLLHAQQVKWIAEAERRGLARQQGARSTSAWLERMLRITPSDAKTRAIVAQNTYERTALTGESLPPEQPDTAEAFSQGVLGLEHVRAIAEGVGALPQSVDHEDRQWAERELVEHARTLPPHELRRVARRIRYHFDQDGSLRDEEYQHERRELHIGTARDGMTVLKARLDRETGAKLRAVLEPIAAPRPATDGERDPRSAGARNADAFDSLLDIALASDQVPTSGGQRAQVAVTINYETLRAALDGEVLGSGTLDNTGEPLSASAVRRLACDSKVVPVVLDSRSEPLDVGRLSYTVPIPMRQAIHARERERRIVPLE